MSSRKKKTKKKTRSEGGRKRTFQTKKQKNLKNLSDFLHIYLSFT
nr:MAG TPA: hypothetical protein [Caudoviricetes sp.]